MLLLVFRLFPGRTDIIGQVGELLLDDGLHPPGKRKDRVSKFQVRKRAPADLNINESGIFQEAGNLLVGVVALVEVSHTHLLQPDHLPQMVDQGDDTRKDRP